MQAVDLSNEPTPKRDNNQLKRPASVSVSFSSTGQLEGSAKTVPAHKLKKPKRLSLPTFLRDYIWTPWTPTLSSLDDVNQPPAIQVNEGVNRGPGRPPYVFSDEQTRKLIKLVIKTDVPFDHIQACLADEVTKKGPSCVLCHILPPSILTLCVDNMPAVNNGSVYLDTHQTMCVSRIQKGRRGGTRIT